MNVRPTVLLLLALSAASARGDAQTEAMVSACADGDMRMCQQLSLIAPDPAAPQTPLERLAAAFAADPAQRALTGSEGTPDLVTGYVRVVENYFATPAITPEARERHFRAQALPECAAHYNEVWGLERNWWPTDAQGAADWRLLYLHMLDHYFGYCLVANPG